MIQEQVLALLKASGTDYLSGQDISRRLGISRAAVWKAVEALRQDGYGVTAWPAGRMSFGRGSSPGS